jgi:hypothetical protein
MELPMKLKCQFLFIKMLPIEIFYLITEKVEDISTFYNLSLCCKNSAIACFNYRDAITKKYDRVAVYLDFKESHIPKMYIDNDTIVKPLYYVSLLDAEKAIETYKSYEKNKCKNEKSHYDIHYIGLHKYNQPYKKGNSSINMHCTESLFVYLNTYY